jgi:pSer/pThr/pTyr-binding forkhead associated (FHA) protein
VPVKISLIVLTAGKHKGEVIPLRIPEFVIGRDRACNLRPVSPIISDRHCAVLIRGNQVFVRDLGSANGTFVNGQPVQGDVELHDQDRLRVAFLTFGIRIEAEATST